MIVVLFTDARDKGQYREREREKRQSGMARRQTVGERQVDALNAVAGQQQQHNTTAQGVASWKLCRTMVSIAQGSLLFGVAVVQFIGCSSSMFWSLYVN